MGLDISSLINSLFNNKEKRILVVGLHGAGKTTFLQKLKKGEVVNTLPTIGFNIKTVEYKNVCFIAFDVGGKIGDQPVLDHYYQNTNVVIFVVDSNQREDITTAREELQTMMNKEILRDASLLVLANKQDLPNAMNSAEITDKLGLQGLRGRTWYIQSTCLTKDDGLYESLEWLIERLKSLP